MHYGPTIVFVSLFIVIFGICYLYYWTRNKERMALIEKGADASIFVKGKRDQAPMGWKIVILNLALLLMGIGLGLLLAVILTEYVIENNRLNEPIVFATIFLMSGVGLLTGFFMTKKLYKEES